MQSLSDPWLIPWEVRLSRALTPPLHLWFFGSTELSLAALKSLLKLKRWIHIGGVVTTPDRPRGRGMKVLPTPVATFAQNLRLKVVKPEKLSELKEEWSSNPPDLFLVCAYGKIFPPWALLIPRVAPINLHASLLPRHRGATPIVHTILSGDTRGGVTLMGMEPELDTGPILYVKEFSLHPRETSGTLENKICASIPFLLEEGLSALIEGRLSPKPQEQALATYAPKLTRNDRRIPWEKTATEVDRRVRAFSPAPGALTLFRGLEIKILAGKPRLDLLFPETLTPGTLVVRKSNSRSQLLVVTGDHHAYEIESLKLPGRKVITSEEFLRGYPLDHTERLGDPRAHEP